MISILLFDRATEALRELDVSELMETSCAPDKKAASDEAGNRETVNKEAAPDEFLVFRGSPPQCRAGELLWIDITAPTDNDYVHLSRRFGFHPMVLEDIRERDGRPKMHDYGDYLFIVCHALNFEEATQKSLSSQPALHIEEVDILVGADYVITIHEGEVSPLRDLASRWKRRPALMKNGAGHLLYEVLDEILDEYFPLLDSMDERIDDFEERLFNQFEENLSGDIFALKRQLIQVRRIAGPMRDVINILLRHDSDSGGSHFAYFQDLYDHAARIVDNVDTFRELMSGALDAYLALASNRMNAVMKTLTSASIILLVPTLIAGVYGMNFENMPELKQPYGYHAVLLVMASAMLVLYAMFKRRGWL